MSLFIKNIFLVQLCLILAILYPTSLANLVVEVGTRHSYQTLLPRKQLLKFLTYMYNQLNEFERIHSCKNCEKRTFIFEACVRVCGVVGVGIGCSYKRTDISCDKQITIWSAWCATTCINTLYLGRCSSDFESIILKLLTWNSILSAHREIACSWIPEESLTRGQYWSR